MKNFDGLVEIADRLLSPNGCPWDREQTLFTLQPYLLEEVHELLEAIDLGESDKIVEELGDVLYVLIFIAKVAEAKKLFSINEAIAVAAEKIIRRHPHVFGETEDSSIEGIVQNWERIKKQERGNQVRTSILDGIPPSLSALARTQKVVRKLRRIKSRLAPREIQEARSEEAIGKDLWKLAAEAEASNIDLESALRRYCLVQEDLFRKEEKSPESGSQQKPVP